MMSIPKIIHQIWVGPNEIPVRSIEFMKKIRELHSDFEYRLWNNEDITKDNFINYEYIMKSKSYAQKADIMRYEILYKHGGVYLDVDFELFKNIENLLTNKLIICNEANINHIMSIGMIGCSKENEQLKVCIDNVKTINLDSKMIQRHSGPWYFRKCIQINDSVRLLPTHYFYPTSYTNPNAEFTITEETYGCHHWYKNW